MAKQHAELPAIKSRIGAQQVRAGHSQSLLNDVGRLLLAEPLASEQGLSRVARRVVPELGDVCAIDLGIGSSWRRAAFAQAAREGCESQGPGCVDPAELDDMLEAGHPVVAFDLQRDRRFGWLRAFGMGFGMGLPLRGRTEVHGMLWLGARARPRDGGASALTLAEGLCQYLCLWLENAQLNAEARAARSVRDEFLGMASHELRTPLTALQLHLETLSELLLDARPDLVKSAHKVHRAVLQTQRMGRLIESLLAVSRIGGGTLALEPASVDVTALVREVVERMRSEAQRVGCRLEFSAHSGVVCDLDPLRIEQVVANLLTNAFRHARGSAVEVGVEADVESVRIRVQDRGPGIPKGREARIFDRFETGVQRSATGLGLGLYISRQLIEAHGGTLELEPSETGASFLAVLPRDPVVH